MSLTHSIPRSVGGRRRRDQGSGEGAGEGAGVGQMLAAEGGPLQRGGGPIRESMPSRTAHNATPQLGVSKADCGTGDKIESD